MENKLLTGNTINMKLKQRFLASKPNFLIPIDVDRFFNVQSRKSQTPMRQNRLISSQIFVDKKHTASPSNYISINSIKRKEIKKRPMSQMGTSADSSAYKSTNNKDVIHKNHRKSPSFNIFQTEENRFNKADNNARNKRNGNHQEKESNINKIHVQLKTNRSTKNVHQQSMSQTNKNSDQKAKSRGQSSSVNHSSNKNKKLSKSSINNTHVSFALQNKEIIKRENKNILQLEKMKCASEKKFKVINQKTLNRKIKKIPYISKVILNTVDVNQCLNTNDKKQKKIISPPFPKPKSSWKNKSASLKLNKQKKRINCTNNTDNKHSSFTSHELKEEASNSLSLTNTNGFDANLNSSTLNNTVDNNRNSFINYNSSNNVNGKVKRPIISLREYPNHIRNNSGQTPIKKNIIKIESITKKGFAGQGVKKINQDNYFIYKNLNREPSAMFVGVCDGHGMFGHDISGFLISQLPTSLNSALISKKVLLSNQTSLNSTLNDVFLKINASVIKDQSIDTEYSGSTCVTIVYTPEKITCANVGDSRAVMGRCVNGTWSSVNLSRDHKPNESDESERIIESGGRIEAYKDDEGNSIGPKRVWLPTEDIPGLAMSRSIGDEIAQKVGVISKPEITEFPLERSDKFVILASDGIWEFIDSDECVNIIKDYYLQNDVSGALSYLCKEASKRWIQQEEIIDDITAILIYFE